MKLNGFMYSAAVTSIPVFLPTGFANDSERVALGKAHSLLLCGWRHICVGNKRQFSSIYFFASIAFR